MKKRIIALFLAVIMLCTLLPAAAFAENAIKSIDICGLSDPKEGAALDYEFSVLPNGSVKNESYVEWFVYNGLSDYWEMLTDPDYRCFAGKTYMACVYLYPAEGSSFDCKSNAKFSGTVYRDGVKCSCDAYLSGDCLCIEIYKGKLPVDSAHKVYDCVYSDMPSCCVIGKPVKDFKPAVLKGAGVSAEYLWFLLKYKGGANLEKDDPDGVYISVEQEDLALRYLSDITAAEIASARRDFGYEFQSDYTYVLCNVQILRDGYAYGSKTLKMQATFTDGNEWSEKLKIDTSTCSSALPVSLTPCKITKPAAPSLSISATGGKVKLKWDSVLGADKYYIYRSTDGKSYKYYSSTENTSYTNSSVTSGTKYYYKVKALNTIGETTYYSAYSSAKSTVPMKTPSLTVSLSLGSVKLSWDKVADKAKYNVYRAGKDGSYSKLTSTSSTSYTDTSAKTGYTYYYKVKAVKTVGSTDWSSSYSTAKTIKVLKAPVVTISKTSKAVKLSWSAISGAEKYYIYRSTDGKSFKYYSSTTKTSYSNSSVTSGKKYYYKVKAVNADGGTGKLSSVNSIVFLSAPVLSVTSKSGSAVLSWEKVTGATAYQVYRSTDGKSYTKLGTVKSNSYKDSSVKKGKTVSYKVRAVKTVSKTDWTGAYSSVCSVKIK